MAQKLFRILSVFFVLLALILSECISRSAFAEDLTSDDIVQSLKSKPKTRGLSAPQISSEDAQFLENMKHKTRGLTIEERTELSNIVTKQKLPAINLEVNFAVNSATLDPTAITVLRKLGTALNASELKGASFMVAGHTDARGMKDYNQKLSENRALAVRTFLANNFNIPAEDLVVIGYGQEQPKNSLDPLADENRRVQIVNLGKN